jgi:hypothetical protein
MRISLAFEEAFEDFVFVIGYAKGILNITLYCLNK